MYKFWRTAVRTRTWNEEWISERQNKLFHAKGRKCERQKESVELTFSVETFLMNFKLKHAIPCTWQPLNPHNQISRHLQCKYIFCDYIKESSSAESLGNSEEHRDSPRRQLSVKHNNIRYPLSPPPSYPRCHLTWNETQSRLRFLQRGVWHSMGIIWSSQKAYERLSADNLRPGKDRGILSEHYYLSALSLKA